MFPAVNLGPLVIPTAAFVLILGAWLCLWVAEQSAKYLGRDPQLISNLVSIMLVVGVVGARLTFVLIYWPAYRNNLLGIIWPLNSGFNLAGGLFFGLAAGFFYARYRQMAPWPTLDVLAPVAVVGLMVVSLADFLGGPGYGEITGVAWGITQFGLTRHPVQLYELLAEALALVVWWALSRRQHADGQLFLVTTALLALGRLVTDAFRENAWLSAEGWHLTQAVCLAIALICLGLLARGGGGVSAEVQTADGLADGGGDHELSG